MPRTVARTRSSSVGNSRKTKVRHAVSKMYAYGMEFATMRAAKLIDEKWEWIA